MAGHPILDLAAHAVGAALLHSMWQGTVIAAAATAALRRLRTASPQARYFVACGALAALLGAFAITAGRNAAWTVADGRDTALPAAATEASPLLGPGLLDFSPAIRHLDPSELNGIAPKPS